MKISPGELTKLSDKIQGEIRFQEPLARYTTWRIGGPADVFVIPETIDDIRRTLAFASDHDLPLFVLGRGSNILIDDAGLPGVVLYMARSLQAIEITETTLRTGGGVALPKLAQLTAKRGFAGFEFLIGIPGTVGAGVLINAGAGGAEIRDVLESVTVLDRWGDIKTLGAADLALSYRHSALLAEPVVVTEAIFKLEHPCGPAQTARRVREFLDKRRRKFPLSLPNAGSTFKRPGGGKGPYAGWLLEQAGMKGYRVGDAQVSELHANFIINLGQASSADVKTLIGIMYERVLEVHNIQLERENIFLPEEGRW